MRGTPEDERRRARQRGVAPRSAVPRTTPAPAILAGLARVVERLLANGHLPDAVERTLAGLIRESGGGRRDIARIVADGRLAGMNDAMLRAAVARIDLHARRLGRARDAAELTLDPSLIARTPQGLVRDEGWFSKLRTRAAAFAQPIAEWLGARPTPMDNAPLAPGVYALQMDIGARPTAGRGPSPVKVLSDLGAGRPLPADVARRVAPHLAADGHALDLSRVRLHTDAAADAWCRRFGANAFAVGRHVAFRAGAFRPDSADGLALLAHELTHVWQHASGRARGAAALRNDPSLERDARTAASRVRERMGREPLMQAARHMLGRMRRDGDDRPGSVFVVADRIEACDADLRARGAWDITDEVPLTPGIWLDGGLDIETWSTLDPDRLTSLRGARGADLWLVGDHQADATIAADFGDIFENDEEEVDDRDDTREEQKGFRKAIEDREGELMTALAVDFADARWIIDGGAQTGPVRNERRARIQRELFLVRYYSYIGPGTLPQRFARLHGIAASEADTLDFLQRRGFDTGERALRESGLSNEAQDALTDNPRMFPRAQTDMLYAAADAISAQKQTADRTFRAEIKHLWNNGTNKELLDDYETLTGKEFERATPRNTATASARAIEELSESGTYRDRDHRIGMNPVAVFAPMGNMRAFGRYYAAIEARRKSEALRGIGEELQARITAAEQQGAKTAGSVEAPDAKPEVEDAVVRGSKVANTMDLYAPLIRELEKLIDSRVPAMQPRERLATALRFYDSFDKEALEALKELFQPENLAKVVTLGLVFIALQGIPGLNVIVDALFACMGALELIDIASQIVEFTDEAKSTATLRGLKHAAEKLKDLGGAVVGFAVSLVQAKMFDMGLLALQRYKIRRVNSLAEAKRADWLVQNADVVAAIKTVEARGSGEVSAPRATEAAEGVGGTRGVGVYKPRSYVEDGAVKLSRLKPEKLGVALKKMGGETGVRGARVTSWKEHESGATVELTVPSDKLGDVKVTIDVQITPELKLEAAHGDKSGPVRLHLDKEGGEWKASVEVLDSLKPEQVGTVLRHELNEAAELMTRFPNGPPLGGFAAEHDASVMRPGAKSSRTSGHDVASASELVDLFNEWKRLEKAGAKEKATEARDSFEKAFAENVGDESQMSAKLDLFAQAKAPLELVKMAESYAVKKLTAAHTHTMAGHATFGEELIGHLLYPTGRAPGPFESNGLKGGHQSLELREFAARDANVAVREIGHRPAGPTIARKFEQFYWKGAGPKPVAGSGRAPGEAGFVSQDWIPARPAKTTVDDLGAFLPEVEPAWQQYLGSLPAAPGIGTPVMFTSRSGVRLMGYCDGAGGLQTVYVDESWI